MRKLAIVLVTLLAAGGCAFPREFAYGFTRPGATPQQFRADLDAARLDAIEKHHEVGARTNAVLRSMEALGYSRLPAGGDPGEFVFVAPLR